MSPLVTDINVSLDDRFLYVACWGTGACQQYDISDPFNPKKVAEVRIGGIANRTPHPAGTGPLNGGPQMLEVSRDGRRVYLTNSLYRAWDDVFYPEGIESWMVKLDVIDPERGGMQVDSDFFLRFDPAYRAHQIRLEGGDSTSDSFYYSELTGDNPGVAS